MTEGARDALIRELQAALVMSHDTAERVADRLLCSSTFGRGEGGDAA